MSYHSVLRTPDLQRPSSFDVKYKPGREILFRLFPGLCCFVLFNLFFIGHDLGRHQTPRTLSTFAPKSIIANNLIPRVLLFTHRYDLLKDSLLDTLNVSKEEQEELIALRNNVHRIVQLHDYPEVRFLTDEACIASIRNVMNQSAAQELVSYFERERAGMFKADLCRGTALYETGGLYFDADLGVRINTFNILDQATELATVRVHQLGQYGKFFFQAFIGVTPGHPVILRYIELFLEYYRGNIPEIVDGDPVGVLLLRMAYEDVKNEHIEQSTEIWNEVLYEPFMQYTRFHDVPYPYWGTMRSCKFVVVKDSFVPFYSRIPGSRLCQGSDEVKFGAFFAHLYGYALRRLGNGFSKVRYRPVPRIPSNDD